MLTFAEYIWLDGGRPAPSIRSKTRIVELPPNGTASWDEFPEWSFDGSATDQADHESSDLRLRPVRSVPDPLRAEGGYLVLCEVATGGGQAHRSNTRATLRAVLGAGAANENPWFGFEQELTLMQSGQPLGGADRGASYCGVGADETAGRELVDAHVRACFDAGLMIHGAHPKAAPGRWEFQIGHRGVTGECADPLTVSDHLWLARYLLGRLGERAGISVSMEPHPLAGSWEAAGNHTSFSTASMRAAVTGIASIRSAILQLAHAHREHLAVYGCAGATPDGRPEIFSNGVADRQASVRVPRQVAEAGCGYLEDRRPPASSDPYVICAQVLSTICRLPARGALCRAG